MISDSEPQPDRPGIRLRRTAEHDDEIVRLTSTYAGEGRFGPVGLAGVLADLNRRASRVKVRGGSVDWGFAWNDADNDSERWWPQGITSSADAYGDDLAEGRRLLVVSWSSEQVRGANHGSRITFVDLDTLEYRHVLLVMPEDSFGEIRMKALTVPAGGLAWFGPYLHVAGTRRGLVSCRLDDILEVRPGPESFGHRFVLPVRFAYETATESAERLRHSFVSVDRSGTTPALLVGEYADPEEPAPRLARFALDPTTHHLRADPDGWSLPVEVGAGETRTRGTVVVDGEEYLTGDRGRRKPGVLLIGRPGHRRTLAKAMPPGPADLAYWPSTDRLWSLTTQPARRTVFCMDRQGL